MNDTSLPHPQDPTLLRWFGWLTTGIAVSAFVGMTITTLLGVAARYMGLRGVEWTFEVTGILFLWTSFFGVIVAELRRENVAFTFVVDKLDSRWGRILAFICSLLTLWLAIELTRSGIGFAARSGMAPTPLLRLPRLVQILPFIIFAGGIALITFLRILQSLRGKAAQ